MDFRYNDDQRSLSEALRGRLTSEDADSCLASLGVFGLQGADSAGGLELGTDLAIVVCEELGRVAAVEHYRAAELLADVVADTGIRAGTALDLLSGVIAGNSLAAAAGAWPPLRARSADGRVELTGQAVFPAAQADAAILIVPAAFGNGEPAVLAVVGADAAGLRPAHAAQDGLVRRRFESVRPIATAAMNDTGDRPGRSLIRAMIRQAAFFLGLSEGAHAHACRWAGRRRQFGHPLVSYQALAFRLAGQLGHIEAVRLLVHRAAWLADRGEDAALAATEAAAYGAELALDVTEYAIHVHGAFGLTRQAPVHRFYQCALDEARLWGAPSRLWRAAAALHIRCPS